MVQLCIMSRSFHLSAISHEQSCDIVWAPAAFSSSSLVHTFLRWGLAL